MYRYLTHRKVTSEHGDADLSGRMFVKKYTWIETNGPQWEGKPPTVEVLIDEQNAFVLRATLTTNRHRSRLGTAQLQALFIGSLHSAGVLASS